MQNDKIDIVYLWVNGSDKKWNESRNLWHKKIFSFSDNNYDALYRDNGELKYSLRSVAENMPWANHIYIITGFNQVPKWLNTKNPKITIVPHEEIIPHDALPTFNSNSIEMCICNIKNLSEKFILINDDMFFNKPVRPEFFFDKRGRSIVLYNNQKHTHHNIRRWISSADNYTTSLILSALKIQKIFGINMLKTRPSHGIDPYLKSSIIECKNHPMIKSDIERQIRNKFRTKDEMQRWLFNMYAYCTGKSVFKKARCYKSGKHKISNFLYNLVHWHRVCISPAFCFDAYKSHDSIKHAPIFCINDSKQTTQETIDNNIKYLQHRFPNKCEFEK